MLWLLLLACTPPDGVHTDAPGWPELEPPEARCLWMRCDPEAEKWTIELSATAWTAGAELVWTPDGGEWLEAHSIRSVSAAADGTSDQLKLTLSVVGDWREVSPGSSTAVRCTDSPEAVVALLDPADDAVSDCARRGYGVAWDEVEGAPECPRYVEARCRP